MFYCEELMLVFLSRIHLMAGRVPAGADRSAVAMEMEDTFVQNLKHAAGVLSQVTSDPFTAA